MEYQIAGNDPNTMLALRRCGLAKFFQIQGMRAQVQLLEFLVKIWEPDEQVFKVGVHDLALETEDIYFFTGLSRRGEQVPLSGFRGGGEKMENYRDGG
jgi:hypothetical protein